MAIQRSISTALLVALAACGDNSTRTPPPTWSANIAPIIEARCTRCHSEDGYAPFSLETFDDVAGLGEDLERVLRDDEMPPWLPSEDCRPLHGAAESALSAEEVTLALDWLSAGMPEGEPGVIAGAPPMAAAIQQVLSVELPVYVGAGHAVHTHDWTQCFKVEVGLSAPQLVSSFSVRPGDVKMVQRVALFVIDAAQAQVLPAEYECNGWPVPGRMTPTSFAQLPLIGIWQPGQRAPIEMPLGTAFVLPSGSFLIAQIDYHPGAGLGVDRSTIEFYAPSEPVQSIVDVRSIAAAGFVIPPETSLHRDSATHMSTEEAVVLGVTPYLGPYGRSLRLSVDGACALEIPRWNRHWQASYRFETPIAITPGSQLTVECTWENVTQNSVQWGEGPRDDTCLAAVTWSLPMGTGSAR